MRSLCLAAAAALTMLASPASAQTTVPGPVVTQVTIAASPAMNALPANPSRRGIMICTTGLVQVSFGNVVPTNAGGGTGNNGMPVQPAACFTQLLENIVMNNQLNVAGAVGVNVFFMEF